MDWLTFFSEIIRSTAWPIAVITVAFVFREPLAKLILLIRKLRVRDVEVTFGEELAKARAEVEEVPVSAEEEAAEHDKFKTLQELASSHPPAAIIESWKLIEDELRQVAKTIGKPELSKMPAKVFLELRRDARIGSKASSLFNRLRHLRNAAVHQSDFQISEGQALEYVDLAQSMAAFISGYGRNREI